MTDKERLFIRKMYQSMPGVKQESIRGTTLAACFDGQRQRRHEQEEAERLRSKQIEQVDIELLFM
jgi:hypothetical protein